MIVVVFSKLRLLRKKIATKIETTVEKPKTINIVSRNSLRDELRIDEFPSVLERLIVEGNEERVLCCGVGTGFDMPNP